MKSRLPLLICFVAIGHLTLSAQTMQRISLPDAIALAVKNSEQLQIDSLKQLAWELKYEQTRNTLLPLVGVTASYTRISQNIDPFTINIEGLGSFTLNPVIPNNYYNRFYVQQPVFSGLRQWNTLRSLENQAAAVTQDRAADLEDLKLRVATAYYSLYKLEAMLGVLNENIVQADTRIKDVENYKKAGLALNNDLMRAQLAKNQLLVNQADVNSAINIARFNLGLALGLNPGDSFDIVPNTPEAWLPDNPAQLFQQALGGRSELSAQALRSDAAEYSVKASKSVYMPTVSFVANGYVNNPNQRVFPQEDQFKSTWDVGISLNWNILQLYTARAQVKEAETQQLQLEQQTRQLREGIQQEVNARWQALKVAQLKTDLAKQAIEQATENKRILDNRFAAEVALLNDVLEADLLLLQARTSLVSAQADAAIAQYQLMRSLGQIKL